ncbi:DUF3592 domain-containing protein [Candidatus Falkowbacteria bacterium]|nr:DUF3592 domain-containing protein [Candidatus Falkowbacteria bacterium]
MIITRSDKAMGFAGLLVFMVGVIVFWSFSLPELRETINLNKIGKKVEGKVIGFDARMSKSTSNRNNASPSTMSYYTKVSFVDGIGNERVFVSKSGLSDPPYAVGDKVVVLYDSDNPQNARIDSFWDNWFASVFLIVFSLIFGVVGGRMSFHQLRKIFTRMKLIQNGNKISCTVTKIVINSLVRINKKNPFVIWCVFQDQATGKTYEFRSDDICSNPKEYIKVGGKIDVYLDGSNYENYFVDISFLPKKIINTFVSTN